MRSGISITKRPPKASRRHAAVRNEVRKGLKRASAKTVKRYEAIVANWRNKPKFIAQVGSGRKQLFFRIFVRGPQRARLIWKWTDKGTKAHTIEPKRAPSLRFQNGYTPKTAPGGRFGGSGRASGPVAYAKKVKHPGTEARNFDKLIEKQIRPELDREIRNGYRRGFRKVRRV